MLQKGCLGRMERIQIMNHVMSKNCVKEKLKQHYNFVIFIYISLFICHCYLIDLFMLFHFHSSMSSHCFLLFFILIRLLNLNC